MMMIVSSFKEENFRDTYVFKIIFGIELNY